MLDPMPDPDDCFGCKALREENARLKAQLEKWESQDVHESMQCYKDTERLTHERDEARERLEVCLRVNENVGKELLAADAEVARLEAKLARCVKVLELRRVNPKPRMTVRDVCEEALSEAR